MAEGGKDVSALPEGKTGMTAEDQQALDKIIDYLKVSGDYVVMTKEEYKSFSAPVASSTPAPTVKTGAIPKSVPVDSHINSLNLSHLQVPKYDVPKLPNFSGDQPPNKGEESFSVWRFETRCLISESLPEHVVLQVVRKSLRGTARRALISLGESANLKDVLQKLDMLFGNVATIESVMQSFYNEKQRPKEDVTAYGCRLESLLQVAVENGHVSQKDRNEMLRSKFWNGLKDEKLKILTRNKYDMITDFYRLLREVRTVELELAAANSAPLAAPAKVTQQQCTNTQKEKDINADICTMMDTLMSRMVSLEKQMNRMSMGQQHRDDSRNDHSNRDQYFSGSQDHRNDNNYRSNNQRSRGRGNNRPWQDRRGRGGNYYNNNDNFANFNNWGQPKEQTP